MRRPVPTSAAFALLLSLPMSASGQDGTLDLSFSGDGLALTEFAPTYPDSRAFGVEAMSDGRIVAFGRASNSDGHNPAAVRFLPNGSPDSAFSADGKVVFEITGLPGGTIDAGKVRPDGKLVVAGQIYVEAENDTQIGLARLTASGTFDATFGAAATPGSIRHPLPSGDVYFVEALQLQSDGKILVAGTGFQSGFADEDFFVARFTESGQFDTSFSGDGVSWIAFDQNGANGDYLGEMVLQPDGRIVVAGRIGDVAPDEDIGFARLLTGGALDTTFDGDSGVGNGRVVWELTDLFGTAEDSLGGLALQPDGRILFSGYYSHSAGSTGLFGRLLSSGAVDLSLQLGLHDTSGSEVLVQSDGKIVVVGNQASGGTSACGAWRFNSNGTALDPTFGGGGSTLISNGPGLTGCPGAVLSRGQVVVAGSYDWASSNDLLVARLKSAFFRDGFESGGSALWSATVP